MDTPRSPFPKRLAAGCLLFTAAAAAQAESSAWTSFDYSLAAGAATMMAVDWAQTRYAARNPTRFNERNPIMGRHPSTGEVDKYFALSSLLTIGMTYILPRTERRLFLGGVLVVETGAVANNYRIGVKVDF